MEALQSDYAVRTTKYTTYDNYFRLESETDTEGNCTNYDWNEDSPEMEKYTYSGKNIDYRITDNKIEIISKDQAAKLVTTFTDSGKPLKEEIADIYKKEYYYDKYSRKINETIDRYKNNEQKKTYYYYNSLGKIEKTQNDDVLTEITQWETEGTDRTRITKTEIMKNGNSTDYTSTEKYSIFGNTIQTTDRDEYTFTGKTDRWGNTIVSTKTDKNDLVIYETTSEYDETGKYLLSEITNSDIQDTVSLELYETVKTEYIYDERARTSTIAKYSNDILQTQKDYEYTDADLVNKQTINIEGNSYIIEYSYNDAGYLTQTTLPDGTIKKTDYNYNTGTKNGRINRVWYNNNAVTENLEYYETTHGQQTGLLKSYKNDAGIETNYTYDKSNRLTAKNYQNSMDELILDQAYSYDMSGNIIKIQENGTSGLAGYFTRNYEYDEYNRLVNAQYNGKITEQINPKLSLQTYDYQPEIAGFYDPSDLTYSNDDTVNIETKSSSILISDIEGNKIEPKLIKLKKQSSSELDSNKILPYYKNGIDFTKITNECEIEEDSNYYIYKNWNITETDAVKLNFTTDHSDQYDEPITDENCNVQLSELIEYYGDIENMDFTYEYDHFDNRINKTQTMYRDDRTTFIKEETDNYTYSTDYRTLDNDDKYLYEYDDDKFLVKKTDTADSTNYWKYRWDAAGNLINVKKYVNETLDFEENYIYDESGYRVKSINTSETTTYIYDDGQLLFEINSTTKAYIYALGELQCIVEDGNYQYYYNDVLGSTRFITDDTGIVLQETITSPFGIEVLNAWNDGASLTYCYAGHEQVNSNTGLTYMIGRWMDNETGRFISPDPARQGINHFVYAGNNPTTYIDPSGLSWYNPSSWGSSFSWVSNYFDSYNPIKFSYGTPSQHSFNIVKPQNIMPQFTDTRTGLQASQPKRSIILEEYGINEQEYVQQQLAKKPVQKTIYNTIQKITDAKNAIENKIASKLKPALDTIDKITDPLKSVIETQINNLEQFRDDHLIVDIPLSVAEGLVSVIEDKIIHPMTDLLNPYNPINKISKTIENLGYSISQSIEKEQNIIEYYLASNFEKSVRKLEQDIRDNPVKALTKLGANAAWDIATFATFSKAGKTSKVNAANSIDEVSTVNKAGTKGSVNFKNKISIQKQMRHIKGSSPINKSYLNSLDDAQAVLDAYNSGNYKLLSQNPAQNTVTIQVKSVTGRYVNVGNPNGLPDLNIATNNFMIQSVKAPKVVPVNPFK